MANTETSVSNLKINRLTQTQLENASSLSNSELYMVDPEFTGGKVLATDSNGDIVETTVAPADIGTVKTVNSTSPDSNGNVAITIPSEVTETTVSNWGFTKNTGTVTSVNNVSPVGGNVTIPVGDTLPSQTGNANKVLGTNGTTASWVEQYSRNIGEIVQSTIPLTDAGLHILDGGIINGSGIYADFVTYIAGISSSYPDLFTTEANWQTALSTYGVCGKFVYDSVNNTVRLPKYNSKIYTGGGNAPVKGNGKVVGLTNGSNEAGLATWTNSPYATGLVGNSTAYNGTVGTSYGNNVAFGNYVGIGITTDGTKSGIIADLANITTSVDGYYYIVLATTTKTNIEVDIDEVATDLNGKVDKSACVQIYPVIETYVNGTSWYRIHSDGWCEQGGEYTTGNGAKTIQLLKSYKNADYFVSFMPRYDTADGNYLYYPGIGTTYTTSSFRFTTHYAYGGAWMACGYLADTEYTGGTYKAYKP